ncbi:MAG: FtsX-like permease family protein, partial [Acidobacteria bacterium]|nr:FtsX-like permease family protein [Acidobacteriota bacterium]
VGGLGLIGLILAAAGLYGLISYSVTQRTREIGIRMALGAQRGKTMAMVLGQAVILVAIGAAIGIAGAAWGTRILASLVYGISLHDPVTFATVVLVMLAVGVLASYVPARRATRIDPMNALRYE